MFSRERGRRGAGAGRGAGAPRPAPGLARWWAAARRCRSSGCSSWTRRRGAPCAAGAGGRNLGLRSQRGPGLLAQRPEESEAAFQARTGGRGRRPVPAHGRPGLLLEDGELFVTGRLKDLIILRGRNLYPQDLELTRGAEPPGAASRLRRGVLRRRGRRGAARGDVRGGLAQAVDRRGRGGRRPPAAWRRRTRCSSTRSCSSSRAALPKTSSGKIQRRACRAALLAGTARALLTWSESEADVPRADAPAPDIAASEPLTLEALEAWLLARIAARLRVRPEELATDAPITSFGLDSLGAVELANDVEALGVVLRMEVLLQGPDGGGTRADRLRGAREVRWRRVDAGRGGDARAALLRAAAPVAVRAAGAGERRVSPAGGGTTHRGAG